MESAGTTALPDSRALIGLDGRRFEFADGRLAIATRLAWFLAGITVAVGIAIRAWYVFHSPIHSDEAIVGLMVQQLLHGHFSAFYWGQAYGGAESYLVAPLFVVFGSSVWVLKVVPILLAAGSGVLTWRIATRLVKAPALAALAGAVVWAFPQSGVRNSTMELGFRGVTLLCGLALVLIALRIFAGRREWHAFAALGLVAGIGWWSSPEVVYYYVPALWLLVAALWRDQNVRSVRWWAERLGIGVLAFVIGALPWIWANFNSGFRSLKPGAFGVPANAPGYGGRLHIFFQYMLPMLFSLREEATGSWLWGRPWTLTLLILIGLSLIVAMVMCLLRDQQSRAIAMALLVFPFILAVSPATWYWEDGRYSNLCLPLVVLVFLVGVEEAIRRLVGGVRASDKQQTVVRYFTTVSIMFAFVFLSVASFVAFVAPGATYFRSWTNPNGPSIQTVGALESHKVEFGYADYWVAYKLDYLSDGGLQITTAGNDVDRWQAQHGAVRRAKSQAWIFTAVDPASVIQFGSTPAIQGPNAMSQSQFLAALARLGIGYHVVRAGLVQAVIPDRRVTPTEVGLPARPAQ